MEVSKPFLRKKFAKDYAKYYEVPLFRQEGFEHRVCEKCGKGFWTASGVHSCGDSEHEEYSFFREKPRNESYASFWKKFSDFFSRNGHEIVPRYPVISRWRDDLYFTIASIVDFQRLENGRVVFEYPANPLVVPQPCLRFPDIANIGVTGRHLSGFMMAGQHSFGEKGYKRDKCIELNYGFLTKVLGVKKEELTYGEDVWALPDFSAFGPCIESFAKGSELVNSVFMQYYWDDGVKDLPLSVIDVGWGFERLLWYYRGDQTIYDATFPMEVAYLKKNAGIRETELTKKYNRISSSLDVENVHSFHEEKNKIAGSLGITVQEMEEEIAPMQALYAVADHTRSLLFALADGGLPSNTAGGYNLRVLFRRALGFVQQYELTDDYVKLFEMHARDLKPLWPELEESLEWIKPILENEEEKYAESLKKAKRMCGSVVRSGKLSSEKMAVLYESHGVTPELLEAVAGEGGCEIDVPSDFYSKITSRHLMGEKNAEETLVVNAPTTKPAYYDDPKKTEISAKVVQVFDDAVALDKTIFYPEGGGQCGDRGFIDDARIEDTRKTGGVILHCTPLAKNFRKGQKVRLKLDVDRRDALTRHHTATHCVNAAAREVLGPHVWQCGSRKEEDEAHLDVTHFEKPSRDQLLLIEEKANQFVLEAHPVRVTEMNRGEAEEKYGFRLYQGGGAIGNRVRVVEVEGVDVEACGGLHRDNTSEIGFIKIFGAEQVQDGVTRLRYAAGPAALKKARSDQLLLEEACAQLNVSKIDLVNSINRLFNEWKERGKQIEKLSNENAKLVAKESITIKDLKVGVVVRKTISGSPELAQKIVSELTKGGHDAVVTTHEGFVVSGCAPNSSHDAVQLLKDAGAKGGGSPRFARGKK